MGQILEFKRPNEDMEELLREFFAAERELENDEVLQEIVRKAKDLPAGRASNG